MPKLLERNIQQLRGSSYIITLPKDWVEESGLEKGSSVLLAVEPYIIRIIPANKQIRRSHTINIARIDADQLKEIIKWSYLSGLDEINIIKEGGLTHSCRNTLRQLRMNIPGMIISHEDDDKIKIEFAELSYRDFTQSLKAFIQAIVRGLNEISKYLELRSENSDLSLNVDECLGYSLILSRIISKSIIQPKSEISLMKIYGLAVIALSTVDIAESISDITNLMQEIKSNSHEVISLLRDIGIVINKLPPLFLDFGKTNINESLAIILGELQSIKDNIDMTSIDSKIKSKLIIFIEQIQKMLRFLSNYCSSSTNLPD